jgi:hypothetical protein
MPSAILDGDVGDTVCAYLNLTASQQRLAAAGKWPGSIESLYLIDYRLFESLMRTEK